MVRVQQALTLTLYGDLEADLRLDLKTGKHIDTRGKPSTRPVTEPAIATPRPRDAERPKPPSVTGGEPVVDPN